MTLLPGPKGVTVNGDICIREKGGSGCLLVTTTASFLRQQAAPILQIRAAENGASPLGMPIRPSDRFGRGGQVLK